MSNIKKHSLFFLMAMLILLIIPMSFAADVDGNSTVQATDVSVDDVGISDVDEIQTSDELEYDSLQYSDDSDVLTDTYDYETYVTDPASSSVDYTKGDDSVKISVKTTYDYNTMSQLSNSKMYAYINDATDGKIVKSTWNTDVYGSAATFSFYLTQFDDYLTDGTNTIIFHPDEAYYDWCGIDTYNYQPLIVTIGGATPALNGVYIDALAGSGGTGTSDDPYHSLSDAYANAADGVIIFKEGTYNFYDLYNPFTLNKDMEFVADGAVYFTSVNNNMFTVSGSSTTTTFRGINFVNATSSKGTIVWALNGIHGALNFIDCNFLNNTGNCLIYSSCAVNMERCNFIDNTVKGTGTTGNYGSGIIFFYESDAANIQYCNFIGNKISAPNQAMVIDWDQQGTIDFENNYVYGTTTQLSNAMIGNTNGAITNGNYVVISAVNPTGVAAGDEPDLEVKFVKMADGSDVGAAMANLTVALVPTVNAVASPITISENSGKAKYTATDIANNETIDVTVNNHVLTSFDFAVSEAPDTTIYIDALAGTGGSGTSDDPYHNLDTALANVEDGGVIKFKEGTYNFYNDLLTTKSLSQNVVFDADGEVNFTGGNAIFNIASVCTVTFNNINIVNMDTTTATIVNAKSSTKGTLNFNDCNFINNKAKTLIYSSCAVNFERCNFIDNVLSGTSTSTGGGIVFFYYSNNAVFKHCNFIGNEISAPNGVLIYDWDKDGTIDFEYNYIYGLTSPLANSALGNTNGAITNDNYVVISPVNPSDVTVGDEVDLVVNFVKMADGSAVGADMANLTVTYVPASENTVESPITISENTGSAKYTATDAVETETVDVKVNDHVLTTFEFTVAGAALADPELSVPETLDVEVGATANIGATQAGDGAISYVSSNESVATVADGVVTGVSEGTATITVSVAETAAYAADSKNVTVTVTAPAPDDAIYVDGFDNGNGGSGTKNDPYHSLKKVIYTDASTNTGKEIKLLPGTYNFAGTTINLYNYDFTLTAADEGVVFTSTKALFQKNRPGSLTVNGVEFSGITSSEAAVYKSTSYSGNQGTVTFNNCTFINNKGTTLIQNTGNLVIKECTFIDNQATGVGSYSACGLINNYDGSANTIDISYSIFINNQIAFNDNQPIFMDSSNTPLPTLNFNYNFVNNNTALTDDQIGYHATITSTDYTIITVTAPANVNVEETVDLVVNFTKSDGSALDDYMPTLAVSLATDKTAATIPVTIANNGGKGQYTAKSGGSYTESGDVKYADNVLADFTFDVTGAGLPDPDLTVPATLEVGMGATANINATREGDGAISYVSSNESVATVDENGVVTGVGEGSATITVSVAATDDYSAQSKDVAVTVYKNDPNLVVPETLELKEGDIVNIGATQDGTGAITYESSNATVATVDADGNIAANAFGTATITVSVASEGNYAADSKTVAVTVLKNPQLVVPETLTLTVGDSMVPLGVTCAYQAWMIDNYTSSNTTVATVTNNGKVSALAVGTTTITVTSPRYQDYASDSKTVLVTVKAAPLSPNLSVPETLEVEAGATANIGATQDGDGVISYVSANESVATVDADGVVTGVAAGTTTITVSVPATDSYAADSKNVTVTVSEPPAPTYDYESTPDPAVVDDYVIGDDKVITVTVVSDYLSDLEGYGSMFAWINGEDDENKVKLEGIDAGASSFTVNLADISDKLVAGNNTITFHPNYALLDEVTYDGDYNFVPLTVTASEPHAPVYDYETTPAPAVVDDYAGGDQMITVTVSYDDALAYYINGQKMKVYINGATTGKTVYTTLYRDATSADKTFTFNLKQFASDLTQPTNTLIFYCDNVDWDFSTTNYNPLTVNLAEVILADPELSAPATLDVEVGATANIGATQVGDGVISYVSANESVATVDADGVVTGVAVGTTTITVSVPATDSYNADSKEVAVTVTAPPAPTYDYESTPDPAVVDDYVIGDDKVITVTVVSDYLSDLEDWGSMFAWINGEDDENKVKLEGIDAGASSFTVNLADISDKLVAGNNTITFHPTYALLDEATYGGNYNFVPLTVTATAPEIEYNVTISDPASATVDYVRGDAVKIMVATTYDYKNMKALDDSKMFAFINGAETGIVVKNSMTGDDVRGSALSFGFNLTQFDEYLVNGVNTIVFHPDESYYAQTNITKYNYQTLTVNVTGKTSTALEGDDLVMDYKDGSTLDVKLVDSNGNPISGARIYVNNTLAVYKYDTNDQGIVSVPVNLKVGEYTFAIRYDGNDIYEGLNATRTVTVNKADTIISVEDVTVTYKENDNYTVTLTDVNGNPIKSALIYVDIGDKVLKYRTDANGVANVPVTLKPGNHTFTVSYDGNAIYDVSTNSSMVTVNKGKVNIDASNLVVTYKDGTPFEATLTDNEGVAISGVTVKFDFMANGVVKKSVRYHTDANGVASAPISVKPGDYECVISFAGNSLYAAANVTKTLTVDKAPANLEASNTEITYKNGNLTARLTDVDGNAIVGATVSFTQGTSTYRYHTDSNGVATAPINLKPGDYNYTISFAGNSLNGPANTTANVKVNKLDAILTAQDIEMTFKDGTNYTAKLTDANGNAIAGVIVKLNRTGSTSTYKYKTDSEGMISVPLNFKVGTYDFVAFIEDSDIYNPVSVATTVTITK